MYTATVEYKFKEEAFDEACGIWKEMVLDAARDQKGFVRMQFLTSSPRALAIGTWQDDYYAQSFMRTGVFKNLLARLDPMLEEEPRPHIWDLACFAEA